MIRLENVTKIYQKGAKPAINDISVNIDRGDFVFLVGPSGSGKTTFLHLILRNEHPNSGKIYVAGQDISTITERNLPKYRRKLGVVFQDFRLLQNKTVYENVAFALKVIGKSSYSIKTLVPEALEMVGLQHVANRMPYELSGGEQQRVAIARAFVNRPFVLLTDEPTGNLDPTTSLEIMTVLESINRTGTTVVMATHNEEIVNRHKKRVIELFDGQIIRDEQEGLYDSSKTYDKHKMEDLEKSTEKFVKNEKAAK